MLFRTINDTRAQRRSPHSTPQKRPSVKVIVSMALISCAHGSAVHLSVETGTSPTCETIPSYIYSFNLEARIDANTGVICDPFDDFSSCYLGVSARCANCDNKYCSRGYKVTYAESGFFDGDWLINGRFSIDERHGGCSEQKGMAKALDTLIEQAEVRMAFGRKNQDGTIGFEGDLSVSGFEGLFGPLDVWGVDDQRNSGYDPYIDEAVWDNGKGLVSGFYGVGGFVCGRTHGPN